jgi:hypothetical protein
MERYDPADAPIPDVWLALDECERKTWLNDFIARH